jgi:hypothetical protein
MDVFHTGKTREDVKQDHPDTELVVCCLISTFFWVNLDEEAWNDHGLLDPNMI